MVQKEIIYHTMGLWRVIILSVCTGFGWLLGSGAAQPGSGAIPNTINPIALGQKWASKVPLASVSIDLTEIKSEKSTFEFRTFDPEGLVFYGDTQKGTNWFILGLREGIPEMQFTRGDSVSYNWGGPKLNDGKWHKLEVESEGRFVKLWVDGSQALVGGLDSVTTVHQNYLEGPLRLSLGAMLMEEEKLFHPLVLAMDGCITKGNWLKTTKLWQKEPDLDPKFCMDDIKSGSYFSGQGLVVFNTSDTHSLPVLSLPAHLTSKGDIIVEIEGELSIKGLTGSLVNIQTHDRETVVTIISKNEELLINLGAEVHTLSLDSHVETLALIFTKDKILVECGLKNVHLDLREPQDWQSQWKNGLIITFGGVPDVSYRQGSDYLLGCLRRIKVQDQEVDLDRALYKDSSISSHSCPYLNAQ
ncbi:sex hormone-binding globulin-like isoform X1 [Arapaima gigas]